MSAFSRRMFVKITGLAAVGNLIRSQISLVKDSHAQADAISVRRSIHCLVKTVGIFAPELQAHHDVLKLMQFRKIVFQIRQLKRLTAWLLSFFLITSSALAATFISTPTGSGKTITPALGPMKATPTNTFSCDIRLEGKIVPGDLEQLKKHFKKLDNSAYLCLNSGGGSLDEALEIVSYIRSIQRPSIMTVIEKDAVCASACALIFMAGGAPSRYGEFPARYLHAQGILNFHSSRIDLSNITRKRFLDMLEHQSLSGNTLLNQVLNLYQQGLRDSQSMISIFSGYSYIGEELEQRWVRSSLFLEVLAAGPDEWLCIDNVDKAGRWNIEVFGYSATLVPQKREYVFACNNQYNWRADRSAIDDQEGLEDEIKDHSSTSMRIKTGKNYKPDQIIIAGGLSSHQSRFFNSCTILRHMRSPEAPAVRLEDNWVNLKFVLDEENTETQIFHLQPISLLPAKTLLTELPGVSKYQSTKASNRSYRKFRNSYMSGCSIKRIENTSLSQCKNFCDQHPHCKAFSFHKVKKKCELKSTITALRMNPFWETNSIRLEKAPKRSVRKIYMYEFGSGFYGDGIASFPKHLRVEKLHQTNVKTESQCVRQCEEDRRCMLAVFSYGDIKKENCYRIRSIADIGTGTKIDIDEASLHIKTNDIFY